MLKTRVMPTMLYRGSGLVKGVGFDSWRPVGSVMQAVKVYNLRQVDELVFLDVSATREERPPDFELIDDIADECFMPLTVGGGVRELRHVERLLRVGADKVAVGSAVHEVPEIVGEIAARFGSQCVVAAVDVKRRAGGYSVVSRSATVDTGRAPIELCKRLESEGVGEILLTVVDRDGAMSGYDVALYEAVCAAVDVPVIASGGAGCAADVVDVVTRGNASAVAIASLFHFTETTPLEIKAALAGAGIPTRR